MKKKHIIDQILNKIRHSEIVYDQASRSVHSTVIQKELSSIKKKRHQYLKELIHALNNRRTPTHYIGVLGNFTTKIWLQINDFIIQRNVPNILITCVEADKELLKCYGKTKEYNLNERVAGLINQQKLEIQMLANDFQKRIKEYPWV